MDLLSIILICSISIITAVYGFFKYSFGYWKSKGVPHDEPSIPYGSLKGLGKIYHLNDIIQKFYDKYKPTGVKLCGAYFSTRPVAILLDTKLMKTILVNDFAHFNERGLYHNEVDDPLSGNIVRLAGDKWKKMRTLMTPTFTPNKIKYMFPTIVEVGIRLRDCLLEMVQQHDEIELKELCSRFSIDVVGTCAFGIDCNTLRDPNAEFYHFTKRSLRTPRHNTLMKEFLYGHRNIGQKLHIKYYPDDIIDFFMKVIHDTVEHREKNNIQRNDFMDILIKLKNEENAGDSITLNELVAQVFIFLVAGFETSSTTLTFTLYELALNPEIQTKARRIVQEAYRKHNGQFTYEMIMEISYIDQILEESMRLYPPAANLTRVAERDYLIPGTNIVIDRDTTVLIPVNAIHLDPEYYPSPEKFDPDRFSNDEKENRDMINWLAFGAGPRNCLGLRFGMMQTRIGLAILLNNFEISITSNTAIPLGTVNKSPIPIPNDLFLKVKPLKTTNE